MKHASLFSCIAAMAAAVTASAAPEFIPQNPVLIGQNSDALNGAPISVYLNPPGAACVYCDWSQDETTVRVWLTGSGTEWTGTLPANHAGNATVVIYAEDEAGETTCYANGSPQLYTIAENTTDANGLTNLRYPNMVNWAMSGTTMDTEWYGARCTRLSSVPQMVRLLGSTDTTKAPVFQGATAGFIRTNKTLPTGVGSIWFKAKMASRNAVQGGTLVVDRIWIRAQVGTQKVYGYQQLAELSVPAATGGSEWHQFHLILQNLPDKESYYRIYNKTAAASSSAADLKTAAIDIQDIVLTPIIPDVIVTKDEADYAPGYPSLQDPIEFHVAVSNRWAAAPAANFTPTLVWRQQEDDPWQTEPMTNRMGRTNTGDGVYACTLDASQVDAGPFEYFYRVDFTGYTPTFAASQYNTFPLLNNVVNYRFGRGQYPYLIHTNDWALLTDANDNISERRSPAYKPDLYDEFGGIQYATSLDVVPDTAATNAVWDFTHRFDIDNLNEGWPHADVNYMVRQSRTLATSVPGRVEIQAPFTYLTFLAADGIRRFRSMYTQVTAVPRPWDPAKPGIDIDAGAIPGLDDCYPMQLVGDYTWQAIIHQTNSIDGAFAITGAMHYVEGATEYGNGATNGAAGSPFFWLEHDQEETAINPPSAGFVDQFGSEAVPHERTVTYYEETLVTNVTTDTPSLLETARPAGVSAAVPVAWATVTGENESWHAIDPAWMKADATRTDGCLVEGVSGDGGRTYFYTQAATLSNFDYDEEGNVISCETNWPAGGAWSPQILDGGATTNLWPAEIPAGWTTVNWTETSAVGDPFPTFAVSSLVTNGWNLSELLWVTNEDMTVVDVTLSESAAGWACIHLDESALAAATRATNSGAAYVSGVELGVHREEKTRKETYYTYRPVPDPYSMSQLGTRVQIDYDGFLMYRFCTTNGEYQVRRAAWQDFNDWAADINWFSRSFGLYDMKTFECDLEGRTVTPFDSMSVRGFEEVSGLAGDHLNIQTGPEYWDGFLAKNAWAIDERQRRSATSENANRAVRLSPFSRVPGSLETTSATRVDGRGTWTMKVRPSADDRIAAVYKNGYSWTDYFLAVQIFASDLSDAQGAYASVIFRYQDSENYAEARLIQKGGYRTVKGKVQLCRWLEIEVWQTVDGTSTLVRPKRANGQNYDMNIIGGPDNTKNYWRYPWWYADEEATTDRFMLKQSDANRPWTLGVAVTGNEAEIYLWGWNKDNNANNLLVDTTTAEKPPLNQPAYYALSGSLDEGTFGFDVYDVAATFRPWAYPIENKPEGAPPARSSSANDCKFKLTKSNATEFKPVVTDSRPEDNYQQTTDRMVDNVKPWTIWETSTTQKAPGIGRGVPTAYYRLRTYRSGLEVDTDFSAPVPTVNDDWSEKWDDVNVPSSDRVLSVGGSYAWQTVSLPMALWDDTYVQIKALPYTYQRIDANGNPANSNKSINLGAPVVDEFACEEWRGKTVYDPELSGNNAAQRMAVESWIGTYAAIVADGRTGRKWQLARSRANPNEAQAVTTPLLEHGIGDIIFKYEVDGGPVTFVVEMLDEDDGSITEVGRLTSAPTATTASFYAPGLKTTTGRLRVRTLGGDEEGSESSIKGILYVDELIAHDYPNDAGTSWEAYNLLISSFITPPGDPQASTLSCQKDLKFDGRAKQFDSMRSAVLNDGTRKETLQSFDLPEHEPFLQTPIIATGIGELSFWYRPAPGNRAPAKLRFFVANSGMTPDDQWVELKTEDLNPKAVRHAEEVKSMTSITNIPPDLDRWTYFSAEFFQGDYRMLRIYAETNDHCRVMVDNVLITEPVRASIDVGSVEFTPGVPVITQDTGATVKLVNPRKNPKDIQVFIDWYALPEVQAQPVPIVTRNIEYEEIREPHEVTVTVNGVKYVATYYVITTIAHTNDLVSTTMLPAPFTTNATPSRWGYENWPIREGPLQDPNGHEYYVRGRGTIGLATNETDGPYVFHSTNTIPTTGLPPDALIQYCVRVTYFGDFGSPILSETQGRTKNGFWFENPSWYAPIDLNLYQGETENPVAHFWNFTVGTNQAFVNEIQPIQYKSTGWSWMATVSDEVNPDAIEAQYVELIGALGGSVGDWTIEHAGRNDKGSLSPWAEPAWTNRLKKTAAFHDPEPGATTNKGWGVYLVGGTTLSSPAADEPLFPAEMNEALAYEDDVDNYGNYAFLRSPYGLTVKRGMGAYADRICWGGDNYEKDVEDLVAAGFRYVGFRAHNTMGSAQSISWRGSLSKNSQSDWDTQSSLTSGGFNPGQEDRLWPLSYTEAEEVPPMIAQPVVTAFGWTNDTATVTFAVWVTNGVELTADDYVWRYQHSDSLRTLSEGPSRVFTVEGGITAPADGGTNTFTVEIRLDDPASANFFHLIATPRKDWEAD